MRPVPKARVHAFQHLAEEQLPPMCWRAVEHRLWPDPQEELAHVAWRAAGKRAASALPVGC